MVLRKNAKIELLSVVPLFERCSKKELSAIAAASDELALPAGAEVVREGDHGREFCIIVDGAADVMRGGRRIASLGQGDFFGEIALITGKTRVATVKTAAPTRLLVLTGRGFDRLTRESPFITAHMLVALAARLPPPEV